MGLALHLGALFAAAWVASSLLVGLAVRAFDERLASMEPRSRARLLLAALVTPLGSAALIVGGVAFPHPWLGLVDHCADHPGHLHLCFLHGAPTPDLLVVAAALVGATWSCGRLSVAVVRAWRGALALRRVLSASRVRGEFRVLPGPAPVAFTVGLLSPLIVVSDAVLSDPPRWQAVLEHERSHRESRDPLMRWLAGALTAFHVPGVGPDLVARLRDAQEFAADETAAEAVGSRIHVAETLVEWMRWSHASRAVGFHSGPLAARVHRLLDPEQQAAGPSNGQLLAVAVALVATVSSSALPLHHAVETLLGFLPS